MTWWKIVALIVAYVVPSIVVWVNGRATRKQLREGFDSLKGKCED